MMIAFDCAYNEQGRGVCAAVLFNNWTDAEPLSHFIVAMESVAPYESGAFYKRELPLILEAYKSVVAAHGRPELLIIDGYTDLADNAPGLGRKLYIETDIPVVGVAKTNYVGAPSFPFTRGTSNTPLYVTTAGALLTSTDYAGLIYDMHGPYRIPTLLKLADYLCRQRLKSPT